MKRIIICCDGTWNSPKKKCENGTYCITNVVKIKDRIEPVDQLGIKQISFYDDGIGTEGTIFQRIYEGATGSGISKKIIEAYEFLIRNYEIGDELFFFGFSRGAYTVRSLAGLIRNSGILRREEKSMADKAYKLYKSKKKSTHPRAIEATLFRKTFAVQDKTPIKFIGVWDTVGSLGNPLFINNIFSKLSISIWMNSFHDTELSSIVENGYQAFAIDEHRRNFKATVWQKQDTSVNQTLEQVWFVGSHSNIGGGLPTTGLSNITLEWMIEKAGSCGLSLKNIPIKSNNMEIPENSWKGFYRLFCKYYRPIGRLQNGNESLDESSIKRLKGDGEYRPKNLYYFFPD